MLPFARSFRKVMIVEIFHIAEMDNLVNLEDHLLQGMSS